MFTDTEFYLAFLGPRDQNHEIARNWGKQTDVSAVTSEYVLMEVGNALLRGHDRQLFNDLIMTLRADSETLIVPSSTELFSTALELFRQRPDKEWSLTDSSSFVIMSKLGITEALTADHHFRQANFRPLLLESPGG